MWLVAITGARRLLGDGDKVLGTRLALHHNFKTGQCNPSYEALARGTGKTVSAIPKQLKRLEEAGFIRRISTKGRYRNSYELTLPADASANEWIGSTTDDGIGSTPDDGPGLDEGNPVRPNSATLSRCRVQPYPAIQTNREENNEKNNEGERYLSERFDDFWNQYPRRVGKTAARKAFTKAVKAGASPDAVIAGVLRYATARTNQDPKYTKHPAAWLNDERWLDEPDPHHRPGRNESMTYGMLSDLTEDDFRDR